jgi:hypothetical protein
MKIFEGVTKMANELVVSSAAEAYMPVLNVQAAVYRQTAIVDYVKSAFVKDKDYGVIPGVSKPSLFKPGAEKLLTFFGLAAQFVEVEAVEDWTGAEHGGEPFFLYRYRCDMYRNGTLLGSGIGSCNSWESKYRYRNAERVCPECGKATLMKSKYPPRNNPNATPGWYCNDKKGGCGANFEANDKAITEQKPGRVPNPDPADVVNTIDKMAQKRALVAGCLITVNASDYFTQDVEDMVVGDNYIDGNFTVTVVNGKEALSGSGNGNGGGVQTTGKVETPTPTVPAGTEPWRTWKNHSDALVWASEQGVYNAPEHAQNSYKLLAEELFPGVKHTSVEQKVQLFEAFYLKVQTKIEIAKLQAAVDDVDLSVDNPFLDASANAINGRAVDVTDSTVAH